MASRDVRTRSGIGATVRRHEITGADGVKTRVSDRRVAIVLSMLVSLPLLGLPLRADERWYPYLFGPDRFREPWTVIVHPLQTVGVYIEKGNFRPLGRMVEHLNYLVDHALAVITGLPMHVVLGLVRMASVIALGLALLVLVDRMMRLTSSELERRRALWLTAAIYPTTVIAVGNLSSMVVFSGMYFQTAAVIVLVAAAFSSPRLYAHDAFLTRPRVVGFLALGAAVAAMNELAYLAAPVAASVVAASVLARQRTPREALRLPVAAASVASAAGFLVVALPARLAILRACRGGACYAASSLDISGWDPLLWGARMLHGFPLLGWWHARYIVSRPPLIIVLLGLLVLAVAIALLVGRRIAQQVPRTSASTAPHGMWWRLLVVGLVMVASAGLLSSLSASVQADMPPLIGWRETPAAATGWTLIGVSVLGWMGGRVRHVRLRVVATVLVLGVAISLTVVTNASRHRRDAGDPRTILADRIAVEMANFGENDARRCSLLEEFDALHPDANEHQTLLRQALERSARARYGVPFCRDEER